MKKAGKYNRFDATPGSAHNIILGLIPRGSRVLEFGCAAGRMSREMVRRLGCEVTGVELVPEAAKVAREWCRRVIVGDAMALDYPTLLGEEKFDVILFADVLEHLYDPTGLLKRMKGYLSKTGAVVSSIPNIAHGSVRLSLMGGEFNYSQVGLLDESHIRFFTLKTICGMYTEAGYFMSRVFRNRIPLCRSEVKHPALPEEFVQWVENQPEADAYQYITRSAPKENQDAELGRDDYPGAKEALDDPNIWMRAIEQSTREIVKVVPSGGHFLLLDQSHWSAIVDWKSRTAHPFPELNGQYGGEPADSAQMIAELKRQQALGNAEAMVLAWPAFNWMDYYEEFAEYVNAGYRVILENERIVIFGRK